RRPRAEVAAPAQQAVRLQQREELRGGGVAQGEVEFEFGDAVAGAERAQAQVGLVGGRRQRRVERACDQWRQRGNAVVEFVVAVVLAAQRVGQGVALAFGRRIAVVAGPGGEVDVLHRVVQGVAETRAAEAAVGRGGSVER